MSRSLDRSYPYWLADRLEVPVEDVIWAAEEYARDYPWDDLEPAPQLPPAAVIEPDGNELWVVVLLLTMIGLAVGLAAGLVTWWLL